MCNKFVQSQFPNFLTNICYDFFFNWQTKKNKTILTNKKFLLAKDLPKLMGAGPNALPNTKGGAILTYGNNVYDLTCTTSSGCKWTENKNQKLAIPRNYHVGISVSAETVLKC